ncbi:ATP-binding protein [Cohnella faecalis]|uniref:histidine kinase n=1 Tax=Cohnella faecalis TaxID=2315694 RepID=A0A398CGJ7_9BACL|nr:ATP-binding protein [Cohnella faecalis]
MCGSGSARINYPKFVVQCYQIHRTGGKIDVHAQLSGDTVTVSVRDNGVGMEEEQLRRLFGGTPLHSLAGTLGEKGAGLGLLVSRQFVERSGGSLWAESKAGQGSAFYFTMRGGAEG